MSEVAFTGERLHQGSGLFGVDLARHEAAYRFALERVGRGRVLDLGSGSGYGVAGLAAAGVRVVGIDRVAPDAAFRRGPAAFVRGDLRALPLRQRCFDWVLSFQVIEHLEDPDPYVRALAGLLRRDGTALVTTPNRLTSDGVNPYHVHEYTADELARTLGRSFDEVQLLGVGASGPAAAFLEARARRVARIVRLDPLRLRDRLPRGLVEWLFGRLAVLVRRNIQQRAALPEASWCDFPIGDADAACVDLLALCRGPR